MAPSMTNLADAFLDARVSEGRGSRTAVRTDDRSWSYAEIQAHANRFAHALAGAGVEPEQRVMIALPDGPEFVGALFGTLKVGGVVVMVNPGLPRDDVAYLVEMSRAKAIVTHRDVAAVFQTAAAAAPTRCTTLVLGDDAFDRSLS